MLLVVVRRASGRPRFRVELLVVKNNASPGFVQVDFLLGAFLKHLIPGLYILYGF